MLHRHGRRGWKPASQMRWRLHARNLYEASWNSWQIMMGIWPWSKPSASASKTILLPSKLALVNLQDCFWVPSPGWSLPGRGAMAEETELVLCFWDMELHQST